MASYTKRRIYAYKSADASIVLGQLFKFGSADDTLTAVAANTDKFVGFNQSDANEVTAVGDQLEIAEIGGGAKALLGGTVTRGDDLMWSSAGLVSATSSARVCAVAKASGVLNDLIPVEVVSFIKP